MKILFLTPQPPYPPHQGTTIRNFNIIKGLAAHHELHLLTFSLVKAPDIAPLRDLCPRIEILPAPSRSFATRAAETFIAPLPDMARRLYSPALAQRLDAMLQAEHYDIIQIEGIEMGSYWLEKSPQAGTPKHAPAPKTVARATPAAVFDNHNAEYILQKTAYETDRRNPTRAHAAVYSYIQWHKLERFERELCLSVNQTVVVSPQDARALNSLDSRINPAVIPNGVDVEYYVPSEGVCSKPLAEQSVVFTGKMDFRPNVDAALWFADEILPPLRRNLPLAHVAFVGQKPAPQITSLANRPGIEVTGWVPDTRPYISDAAVYVVPLRMGGGTRLKVLEAMAMGKAIVSTSRGVEGIACRDGREVIIAERAEAFAAAIVSLMRDPSRARELGMNARQLAVSSYDWRLLIPKFEEVYDSTVASTK